MLNIGYFIIFTYSVLFTPISYVILDTKSDILRFDFMALYQKMVLAPGTIFRENPVQLVQCD